MNKQNESIAKIVQKQLTPWSLIRVVDVSDDCDFTQIEFQVVGYPEETGAEVFMHRQKFYGQLGHDNLAGALDVFMKWMV